MDSSNETKLPPELAAIHAEAVAIDPPAPPTDENGQPVEEAAPVDYMTDALGLTEIVAAGLGGIYPSTEKVLTPDTRKKFAAALAPVMEKYGMSLGVFFGRFGAEVNLLFVTAGFAIPLVKAIGEDRQAAKVAAGEIPAPKPIEKAGLQPVIDRTDPGSLHTRA